METYDDFTARILAFQLDSVPPEPTLGLSPALSSKVAPATGEFRPFHGDTVAYFLDDAGSELVAEVTRDLYARFAPALSAPIPIATAHVTLHDLRASAELESIRAQMESSRPRVEQLVARARELGPIHTACTAVFNLVNTSIAIGLAPADESEHRKLMQAHALFDEIVTFASFTPHITLAYYRPEPPVQLPGGELREKLAEVSMRVQGEPVLLDPARLFALRFDSMSNYWQLG
ncbi:hypothetical protein ABYF34_06790 [Buchananella felis]|uniref:hypothetical protein n=1 Tax=Buchananella felis TaxID=3231492 RepID=UPI003529CA57